MAVLDYDHDGRNSLFVMEGQKGFRLLSNQQGHFEPLGALLPAKAGASYRQCLAGDLNNDRLRMCSFLANRLRTLSASPPMARRAMSQSPQDYRNCGAARAYWPISISPASSIC